MMTNAPSTSRRIALDERQQLADDQPHHDDAEDAAGQDHPRLRRHRDRHQNRVDREDDVGELDLHDRRPERATARATACAFGGVRRVLAAAAAAEVPVDQVQQVAGADQLHPAEPDQIGRQQRRDGAEREGADDAVAQRLLLLRLRAGRGPGRRAPSRCRRSAGLRARPAGAMVTKSDGANIRAGTCCQHTTART